MLSSLISSMHLRSFQIEINGFDYNSTLELLLECSPVVIFDETTKKQINGKKYTCRPIKGRHGMVCLEKDGKITYHEDSRSYHTGLEGQIELALIGELINSKNEFHIMPYGDAELLLNKNLE